MYRYNPEDKAEVAKLKNFEEFQFDIPEGTTFEQIAKYIIYLYDKDSELRSMFFDYRERKKEAARLAGFKKGKDGKFQKEAEGIVLGQNKDVNHAIMCYLRQSKDPDFIMYSSYWELLSKEIEDALAIDKPKDREYSRKNIDELGNKISELEKSIFGGVEVEELRKSLYAEMEKEKLRLRPELVAQDIRSKKLNIGNPYEK
jgi:hypothetical protein